MPSLESEVDAQFYEMIYRVGVGESRVVDERRSESRHPYHVLQKVAPYDGRWFPISEEFVDVQCHDLTRSGFSFLFPRRPAFKSIVASFEGPDETMYFEAEVTQVSRALIHPGGQVEALGQRSPSASAVRPGARAALLIGCRFVRRIRPE
ncbi:MAG: hypothetical protein ACYC6Y_02420 [Thermoguttaceae bacterium]